MRVSGWLRGNLRWIAIFAGLLLLALLVYSPALHGAFIWDDTGSITENKKLTTWAGLIRLWTDPDLKIQYYPLCLSTFWLDFRFWGLNPLGYHIDNIVLHAFNAWLLWRILKYFELPGAAFAALLFLLHPMHTESVAWVTERKNVLSTCFYLLAMAAWLRFDPLGGVWTGRDQAQDSPRAADPPCPPFSRGGESERADPHSPYSSRGGEAERADSHSPQSSSGGEVSARKVWYAIALALYGAALLSKTVTCSLPAVLLLLIWWRRGAIRRADVVRMIPFFCLGIAMGLVTSWVETNPVGAQGSEFSLSLLQRILVAGRALLFYAGKLAWPSPLTFVYPRWHPDPHAAWQWVFPVVGAGTLALLYFLRRRLGRGPVVAALCFAGTQLPMLGFLNVYFFRYSFVSDHWIYLGSIFVFAAFAAVAARMIQPAGARIAGAAVVLAILAVCTWRQAHIYAGPEAVWRDTLAKNPECWLAHNNLGTLLRTQGDLDGAAEHFRAALALYPGYEIGMRNLAGALSAKGDLSGAEAEYDQLIARFPAAADLYCKLSRVQDQQGRHKEAIASLTRAIALKPDNAEIANELGMELARRGQMQAAEEQFAHACASDGAYESAFLNRAHALILLNRPEPAAECFRHVLAENPQNPAALLGLADLDADNGKHAEAAEFYRSALEAKPDWPEALLQYAWLLATSYDDALRNPEQAVELAEKGVRIGGASPKALIIQAAALAAHGEFEHASRVAGEAAALAEKAKKKDLAALAARHEQLYRSGKAYRQEAAGGRQ